jgi:hypothetical protein
MNIDGKAWNNIPEAVDKLALSAHLLFLFNSENPVIHSYLYNISIYHIAVDKIAKIKFYPVSFA